MNILFLCKYYMVGGIEVVTSVLAREFADRGHSVVIATFNAPDPQMVERLDLRVPVYTLHGFRCSITNIAALRSILMRHKIDVVINQWGLPFIPMLVLKKAAKGMKLSVISVYHNSPDANARLKGVEWSIGQSKCPFRKLLLTVLWHYYRVITGLSMAYVYRRSDIYALLSESYIPAFRKFIFSRSAAKVRGLPNPVAIDNTGYHYSLATKEKEILYVGRIDLCSKRVERLIDTWALLEKDCPDWRLTVVGDGPEKDKLWNRAVELDLNHVTFECCQDPKPYYERASILVLTSEWEGFPLVLAESMSFGVVPVVYGSFSAVYDIISDNKDGCILKPMPQGYDPELMAKRLHHLLTDDKRRSDMAMAAMNKSRRYVPSVITDMWESVFQYVITMKNGNKGTS